jgi:hypothetical protein
MSYLSIIPQICYTSLNLVTFLLEENIHYFTYYLHLYLIFTTFSCEMSRVGADAYFI